MDRIELLEWFLLILENYRLVSVNSDTEDLKINNMFSLLKKDPIYIKACENLTIDKDLIIELKNKIRELKLQKIMESI